MERKQKKFEGEINAKFPSEGWDPLGHAHQCIGDIKRAVDKCDSDSVIAYTGCAFGNAEAAFYEKQANEDEMNTIKDLAVELRSEFSSKCKCVATAKKEQLKLSAVAKR